jgi:phosphatidylinositol glycan class N
VFQQFEQFIERSKEDHILKKRLHEDKIVFFFHLLATDTIGHSKKPFSEAYVQVTILSYSLYRYTMNIEKVDKGVKRMVHLINSYYDDNATSFVFTADHGMSDKGKLSSL